LTKIRAMSQFPLHTVPTTQIPPENLSDIEPEPDREDETPDGETTPNASNTNLEAENPEGTQKEEEPPLLLRDKQKKTALYDYASDRQTSQEEAKQFYQRHQLESSATSMDGYSPVLLARTSSLSQFPEQDGILGRSESLRTMVSHKSRPSLDQPLNYRTAAQQDSLLQADSTARAHSKHPGLPHEQKPPLLATEGIHGAGAGVGIGNGAGGFAPSDASVTVELSTIYTNIQKILDIRHKYMRLSLQGQFDNPKDDPEWELYPPPPDPHWDHSKVNGQGSLMNSTVMENEALKPESIKQPRKPGEDIGGDFNMDKTDIPGPDDKVYRLDKDGVYQIYENAASADVHTPIVNVPTLRDFYVDLEQILDVSSDGPSKSFAFRRLQYLEGKFNLYILLNEYQEMADTKRVPHRDFYNVRKVDTHVHHSACMNQKHLLRFIKSKVKKYPDEMVLFRDDKYLTLQEVFESINLTAYDLSIDTLDMHVC
jgi:AMP deaminase